jgi:hypothetical protein
MLGVARSIGKGALTDEVAGKIAAVGFAGVPSVRNLAKVVSTRRIGSLARSSDGLGAASSRLAVERGSFDPGSIDPSLPRELAFSGTGATRIWRTCGCAERSLTLVPSARNMDDPVPP